MPAGEAYVGLLEFLFKFKKGGNTLKMSLTSYVDVFPVVPQTLPKLFAYTVQAVGDELAVIGGKLAYRLKAKFGGNWIWCSGQIVADKQVQDDALKDFLKELWGKEEESLKDAQSIKANSSWEASTWETR